MQEKEAPIGTYDNQGNSIESKPRREIDKKSDVLKTANILLTSGDKVFMTLASDSAWPGKWGGASAGLVRSDEGAKECADRTLKRELDVNVNLEKIYERYREFNGVKRIFCVFHGNCDENLSPNPEDILEHKWVSYMEAQEMINEGKCMPTFEAAFSELAKNLKLNLK